MRKFVAGFLFFQCLALAGWLGHANYQNSVSYAEEKSRRYEDVEVYSLGDHYDGFYGPATYKLCANTNNGEIVFTYVYYNKLCGVPQRHDKGKIVFSSNWFGVVTKTFVPHKTVTVE